jgi:uncharacterized damage-inducible protein DinB
MKALLQQFSSYNIWANKLLFGVVSKLSDAQINETIQSSFPSIKLTVKHMWAAEEIWWQRIKLIENVVVESEKFEGDFNQIIIEFGKQSLLWKDWIDNLDEKRLKHVFQYVRKKQSHKMITANMLLHLFNHATLHRGQIITMLRQMGVTKIPSTDFSTYVQKAS